MLKKLLYPILILVILSVSIYANVELIHGSGNINGKINPNQWQAFGGTWHNGTYDREYQGKKYLYIASAKAQAGSYQSFSTQIGKTYSVSAALLGADVNRNENFIKHSYVTISASTPKRDESNVFARSQKVIGNKEVKVDFTFEATSTTTYLALRSDTGWQYANARDVSVIEKLEVSSSTEFIYGGGNSNGKVDSRQWKAFGKTWNNDTFERNYQGKKYLYIASAEAQAGSYQSFSTQIGKTYSVSAVLLGADVNRNENFIKHSYVTISASTPKRDESNVFARSQKVTGNKEVKVDFTFEATSTTTYLALRSDTGWQYASARDVSVTCKDANIDTLPPVITLNGSSDIALTQGSIYTELGASAVDGKDGNVTVSISGSVDTSKVGTYTMTYHAKDKAGNESVVTRTVQVKSNVIVLKSLSLESNVTVLNAGEKVSLTVMGTYSDGSTQEVNHNIEYIITPADSVEVNGNILTAKKDASVTVQAKVGTLLSNTLNITIAWVVNGHVLPPEPDPAVNNATLLGVDSNGNGVRDDVERWIYKKYQDKHPIHIDIAMQAAKAYKLVLETPEKAKDIHDEVNAPLDCELYYRYCVDDTTINEKRILNENEEIDSNYFREKIYFNTDDRMNAYVTYDKLLSGDSYTLPRCKKQKEMCDFDTAQYEE